MIFLSQCKFFEERHHSYHKNIFCYLHSIRCSKEAVLLKHYLVIIHSMVWDRLSSKLCFLNQLLINSSGTRSSSLQTLYNCYVQGQFTIFLFEMCQLSVFILLFQSLYYDFCFLNFMKSTEWLLSTVSSSCFSTFTFTCSFWLFVYSTNSCWWTDLCGVNNIASEKPWGDSVVDTDSDRAINYKPSRNN